MVEKKEIVPVTEGHDKTIKEILELLPRQLIWKTAESIKKFRDKTQIVDWDPVELGRLMHDIIEYLADYEASLNNIEEVAEQQRIWYDTYYTGSKGNVNAENIAQCVKELALEVRQSLLALKAYQYRGVLMYEFRGWLGDDVVLERLPYDRISFLDDPINKAYNPQASLRELSRASHPEYRHMRS